MPNYDTYALGAHAQRGIRVSVCLSFCVSACVCRLLLLLNEVQARVSIGF